MPQTDYKEKVARLIKEGRRLKGLTQNELASFTGISLRSVQRIENGEVIPRAYTLRILMNCLEIDQNLVGTLNTHRLATNLTVRRVLSFTTVFLAVFIAAAFISQSPRFPETSFEGFMILAFLTSVCGFSLYKIWK